MSDATPPAKSASLIDTLKSDKRVWVGGGVVAVAAVAAGLYFGGVFGPSSHDICYATLKQAKDYGVISPSAELSGSAKSTDVKNRKSCGATAGGDTYTLLADVKKEDSEHKKCRDLKKQNSCVALYSVARADGMTTYQVREIPPGETDEALAATEGQQQQQQAGAPSVSGAPATGQAAQQPGEGTMDTETAVDNSGSMHGPQQGAQQQPAPQQ
ncbi:hypothetical protein FHS83_001933 [Rhizomicrobium palustre]|uniref:Uncharacterized protein n=1 Tax=Rhizomicrobium palustre TaxID=189966 RepID=A0A846MZF2_9PROT|nr:hypothetical protein [Rhizomicrobium palustre]NIK88615.1 hypothetical protein [Rhizomicrobium palustre]